MKADFNLCDDITKADDLDDLLDHLQGALVYMSMTDYPYAASFLESLPANPVNVSCENGFGTYKPPG